MAPAAPQSDRLDFADDAVIEEECGCHDDTVSFEKIKGIQEDETKYLCCFVFFY